MCHLHAESEISTEKFIQLLKGCLSLDTEEKQRVLEAMPGLHDFQIQELVKVFEQERHKFAELYSESPADIHRLMVLRAEEWNEIRQGFSLPD